MGTNNNINYIKNKKACTAFLNSLMPVNKITICSDGKRLFVNLVMFLVGLLFVTIPVNVKAAQDPEVVQRLQGGITGPNLHPIINSAVCDVQDPVYYDLTERQRIEDITKDKYKNSIALIVDEASTKFIPNDFSYTVTVNITYYDLNENPHTITGVQLTVNYTINGGQKYDARQYYYLADARKVTVEVTNAPVPSGSAWDPRKVLTLENRLIATRDYKFLCQSVVTLDSKTALQDELNIKWLFGDDKGATHFDVEWAWVDEESIDNYTNSSALDPNLIFRRNATRVTVEKNVKEYNIPLLYDGSGRLFYRIRPVQYKENGDIVEGVWNVLNSVTSNDYYAFAGHEENQFNWQASTSFAEQGKRKTVIQYFDGTLRSRQTVTKDNSTPDKNTVVAETYYDYQGRPAINILPAPTLNTVLSYARNFNRFTTQTTTTYQKDIYDLLGSGQTVCQGTPVPLDNVQGTSQYYSVNNPLVTTSADNFNKYIPDAQGFPYAETRYTPDATGRIAEQSGVGPDHQLNSGHQTKYYYGSPDQKELDALFGVEAGYASHYFKNMVQDANGQVSVSYTDMHGRTVATALAGNAPANLTALTAQAPAVKTMTKDLLTAENNVVQGRSVVSTTTLQVEKSGPHTFQYNLDPLSATVAKCNPPGDICYDCYYELKIKITDACGNIKLDEARDNLSFVTGAYDLTCTPQGIVVNFAPVFLEVGEYNVSKILTVSKHAQDWYRENVFKIPGNGLCKTIETIKSEVLANLQTESDCANMTCASCTAAVGATVNDYRNKFLAALNLPANSPPNTVLTPEQEADIITSYNQAIENCSTLCNQKETALDMIEQAMLEDMTPTAGQYARTDFDYDGDGIISTTPVTVDGQTVFEAADLRPYNVLSNAAYPNTGHITQSAPYYKQPLDEFDIVNPQYKNQYKTATGMPDPSVFDPNGVIIGKDEFAEKFAAQWAKSLLYYHPEYPKLKYAKDNLKPSYAFDLALEDVETWAQADALGYISGGLENYDPFFTGVGAGTPKSTMHGYMNTAYNGGGSLWKLAAVSIMCLNNNTDGCYDNAPSSPSSSNWSHLTARCTSDKDYIWQVFKALYFSIKNNLVSQHLDFLVPSSLYDDLKANHYERRFGTINEYLDGQTLVTGIISSLNSDINSTAAQDELDNQYAGNCDSYIDFWKNELEKCDQIMALSQTNRDLLIGQITTALKNICIQGSDEDHPLGSSSVKPTSANTNPNRRFEDAIENILANFTPHINISALCHPFMISYPRPYENQPPLNDDVVIDSKDACLCANLDQLKQKMIAKSYDVTPSNLASSMSLFLTREFNITMTSATLQSLLDGCASTSAGCTTFNPPLVVPGFLTECNTNLGENCIECEQYHTLKQEFIDRFHPLFDNVIYANPANDDERNQNELFASFMNNKTGFNKTWIEYLNFDNECAPPPSVNNAVPNAVWTPPIRLCGMLEPHTFPPADDEDPCDFLEEMALRIATEQYKIYETKQLDLFDNTYLNRCLEARNYESFTVTAEVAEYQYTLYYYDQAGNLVKTVPPEGVHPDFSAGFFTRVKADRASGSAIISSGSNNNVPPHTMVTQYRYNSLNQVVAQISPDGGLSHFWYDHLGRLVVSQNAKQKVSNRYSYTLYDKLGRIKEVGQKPNATAMQQSISQDDVGLNNWIYNGNFNKEQVTRTTYDVMAANVNPPPVPAPITQQNLRNRVSFSQVFDNDPDAGAAQPGDPNYSAFSSATYYSYDIHGNVDVLLQDYKQLLGSFGGNRFKLIKYKYDLISGKVNEVAYQPGYIDQFYHRYDYDAENKLTEVNTSKDGLYWERDAKYQYYRHGPLARTELGQLQVQGLDYAYTIQGWLKGVNSTAILPVNGTAAGSTDIGKDGLPFGSPGQNLVARDAYSYSLNYFGSANGGDYKPIGSVNPFAAILPAAGGSLQGPGSDGFDAGNSLFNGNIAAMAVNIPVLSAGSGGGNTKVYGYKYDQLNRIVRMNAYTGLDNATNTFNPISVTEDYKERVSYDANGNILTYLRNGDANRPGAMDNMSYSYKPGNNQLDKVADAAPDASTNDYDKYKDIKQGQNNANYQYDEIGNLISDASENITNIEWNVYGKIQQITKGSFGDQTFINYTYDASGNRISKSVQHATAGQQRTIYARDASGNVMSVYTETIFEANHPSILAQSEVHLYGSSRLGILNTGVDVTDGNNLAVPTEGITTFTRGNKLFELSNHLGNVLVTISDKKLLMVPDEAECQAGGAHDILNVYTRSTQLTYVARQQINFWPGFESRPNDEFTAYIDPNLDVCVPPDNIPAGSYYTADVITANDYYPFGMAMPNRSHSVAGSAYRYGFQNQEVDKEFWGGAVSYLYRVEDARIGRFFSTDPLEKDYPYNSPYAFSENRVLDGIELEGAEWKPVYGYTDKDHKNAPIDYKWGGYNPDGTPVAGSVSGGSVNSNGFSFYFSSNAKSLEGYISIQSKTQEPTSMGWTMNNGTAYNYLINIKQTYKYPSSYKITGSIFSSTHGLDGSQLLACDVKVSYIDRNEGLFSPDKANPTGSVLLANAMHAFGVGQIPRTGIDQDGLGPVDWILGGEAKLGFKLTKSVVKGVANLGFRPRNFRLFKFGFNYAAEHGLEGRTLFHFENGSFIRRVDYHNLPLSKNPISEKFLHYHYSDLTLPKGSIGNSASRHLQFGTGINITNANQLRYNSWFNIRY